jgi:transcriptional regulator with XRE-family HTH domain
MECEYCVDYSEKVKEYIQQRGITQVFLCKKTGIRQETMSRILNGKRKMTLENLLLICNALNENIDVFLRNM